MKTLVIGTGGREHALALALSRDPGVTEVHAAPGNPGMETVAEHVEEPFGRDEDDLDLDAMCDGIARTVREIAQRREPARESVAGRSL